jgi:squalene-hopene/tetraprenyl-beta-curcumene cyclase
MKFPDTAAEFVQLPPRDPPVADAQASAAGSSFYAALRILPPAQRRAMFEIYRFCRTVDDIADRGGDRQARLRELAQWRAGIDALFRGLPPDGLQSLLEPIRVFALERDDFVSILDGMEMDVREDIRAPDVATLELYCDRVACAVGRLSVRVFGMRPQEGSALAFHLGRALQLTNILRDLDEDGAAGRLYLPREALRAAGIGDTDPAKVLSHPSLGKACSTIVDRARGHFAEARNVMANQSIDAVRTPLLMAKVYQNKLERLAARGWAPPRHPIRAGRGVLLWNMLRHGLIPVSARRSKHRPLHPSSDAPEVLRGATNGSRPARIARAEWDLERSIEFAAAALLRRQHSDGHWVFELEADVTISAEYIVLQHFLGEPNPAREAMIATYLRRLQCPHGGWALFPGGEFNISASVKAYFALKLAGDSLDSEHMRQAREAILAHGGAGKTNVFTRILLALFGVVSWSAVPIIPVEIILLPRWFPFHLSRISYWSRTVLVPLLVLQALKPRARNPRDVRINELFPERSPRAPRWARAPHQSRARFAIFTAIDALLRVVEPLIPRKIRARAIAKSVRFVTERLNGEDGLGAIFPAMANTVMMFDALGYARDHGDVVAARNAIDKLLVLGPTEAYCQPCVSPVWDTVLACQTLLEVGSNQARASVSRGLSWLKERQVLDTIGDWAEQRPHVRPGGWAFQYANPHYPDLDDTAAVVMAMDRFGRQHAVGRESEFDAAILRGRQWVLGLQSANGGWGAFDADNTSEYLNHIPFADHGALLDPPTADVTARCVSMIAQLGNSEDGLALARALEFLRRTQEENGSWYGRWGMNFVYGTWSVLCALDAAGISRQSPMTRRAAEWLVSTQNDDGGWGETGDSYALGQRDPARATSTASQTAWALLGLMAAGEVRNAAVTRGVDYLLQRQGPDGFWNEPQFTATGFPRVFYLRYHGYARFFPLWALARYENLIRSGEPEARFGM